MNGRIKSLQTGNPHPLHLLSTVDGTKETETELHIRFDRCRISGEWFRPSPEIIEFVASSSDSSGNVRSLAIRVRQIENTLEELVLSLRKLDATIENLNETTQQSRISFVERLTKERVKTISQELEKQKGETKTIHRQIPPTMAVGHFGIKSNAGSP